jgi:hypothetical protein
MAPVIGENLMRAGVLEDADTMCLPEKLKGEIIR